MDYKHKYLKYKTKYLNLLRDIQQKGGEVNMSKNEIELVSDDMPCNKSAFRIVDNNDFIYLTYDKEKNIYDYPSTDPGNEIKSLLQILKNKPQTISKPCQNYYNK